MRFIIAAVLLFAAHVEARAETIVIAGEIAARIGEAIAMRVPTHGQYRVTLPDPGYQLALPDSARGTYDIAALTYDPARHTFTAALAYTNAIGEREYVRMTGHAAAFVTVPALTRDVAAGETIAETDLTTVEVIATRSATLMTSAADLAGQSARRPLRAHTPLSAADVRKPIMVKRGELVTVIYAIDGIELSAQGQAQADAGKGDTVPVLNIRSRRTIEARVIGSGLVTVTAPHSTLAAR